MKYGFHIVCCQFISAGILLDGFIQLILRVLLQDLPAITVRIVGTFVVSQCLLFSQFTLILLGQLLSRWQLFSFTALQHSWFPKEIITIANSNWNIFFKLHYKPLFWYKCWPSSDLGLKENTSFPVYSHTFINNFVLRYVFQYMFRLKIPHIKYIPG